MLDYCELFAYPDHFNLFSEEPTDMKMKCVIKNDCYSQLRNAFAVRSHISSETA
jgi:hypothetical protein